MREDAHENAYESLCIRLKDAELENVRLKGVVAVQRSKREQVETVLDDLVSWMSKLSNVMAGESLGVLSCSFIGVVLPLLSSCLLTVLVVVSVKTRLESEVVQTELYRLEEPVV